MKLTSFVLAVVLSSSLQAALPDSKEPGSEAAQYCHRTDGRYSPGAIIKQGEALYRCVAAYDAELKPIFVWVRITDATQQGREISIYWQ